MVQNLEKERLVERIRSNTDRRVVHVDLSSEGRERFAAVFPEHAAHIQTLASVLSVEEQSTLAGLLKKLGLSIRD